MLLIGDHPPAAFVTEDRAARGVPVHVVAAPGALAAWRDRGFADGFAPPDPGDPIPPAPMSDLPRWLLGAEGESGGEGG